MNAGDVSTIAFIAGGALLAGGMALYFTSPGRGNVAIVPSVNANAASVGVAGSF